MRIEIVYALRDRQSITTLELGEGATVADALAAVADRAPFCQLDLTTVPVGIHGEVAARDTRLRPGDRVEVYRRLLADPMEARRRRARRR